MLEAWAIGRFSCQPEPGAGQQARRQTFAARPPQSPYRPEARLYRKCNAGRLSQLFGPRADGEHAWADCRTCIGEAGRGPRTQAALPAGRSRRRRPRSLGQDKQCQERVCGRTATTWDCAWLVRKGSVTVRNSLREGNAPVRDLCTASGNENWWSKVSPGSSSGQACGKSSYAADDGWSGCSNWRLRLTTWCGERDCEPLVCWLGTLAGLRGRGGTEPEQPVGT